ncbi:MAG: response regulator [Bacteroidota bacterium]|nr:response regulator [Bacteroidota bacterium]
MKKNIIFPYLKVITVDDSPLIADRTESIVREIEGLKFLGNAFNISCAKSLISVSKPDVVILDINLNDDKKNETGIDLLIYLRQNFSQIKTIIFTNHNEAHYRSICIEKGANHFFDKSSEAHKITEVLKQWTIQ